jgi:Na+-driven multidrug efflux pump
MIPAEHALRSLLGLKLSGSRRHSHVMADVFDQGLASSVFSGMGVLVARFAGANEPAKVNRVVYQSLVVALGLSLLMAGVGYAEALPLLDVVHAAPEVKREALPFLRAMFLGIFGMMMFFMLSGALRAAGDARTAGQNLGAANPERASDGVAVASRIGLGLAAIVGTAFLVIPGSLLAVFGMTEPVVTLIGEQLLMFLSVSGLFVTVALSYTGGLQGTGDTRSPLYILSVLRFRQGAWRHIRVEIEPARRDAVDFAAPPSTKR